MAEYDLPPPQTRLMRVSRRTRLNAQLLAGKHDTKRIMMYYTYVLQCRNTKHGREKLYVGSSGNLRARLKEHKAGEVKTTKSFDAFTLVYYEACLSKKDARKRELQLKTGFGRGYLNKRLEGYLNDAGVV